MWDRLVFSYLLQPYLTIEVSICGSNFLCVWQGQATLVVADKFTEAVGCDPSSGMVENARLAAEQPDVVRKPSFVVSSAESLGFLENSSVDMAIAGKSTIVYLC